MLFQALGEKGALFSHFFELLLFSPLVSSNPQHSRRLRNVYKPAFGGVVLVVVVVWRWQRLREM